MCGGPVVAGGVGEKEREGGGGRGEKRTLGFLL